MKNSKGKGEGVRVGGNSRQGYHLPGHPLLCHPPRISATADDYHHSNNQLQWNLSIKDTLTKGHLSNEDTVCSLNHIELCTNLPLN